VTISLDIPDLLASRLRSAWGDRFTRHVLEALAAEGYHAGELSVGRVAEVLGLGVIEAEQFLLDRGLRIDATAEQVARDASVVARVAGRG